MLLKSWAMPFAMRRARASARADDLLLRGTHLAERRSELAVELERFFCRHAGALRSREANVHSPAEAPQCDRAQYLEVFVRCFELELGSLALDRVLQGATSSGDRHALLTGNPALRVATVRSRVPRRSIRSERRSAGAVQRRACGEVSSPSLSASERSREDQVDPFGTTGQTFGQCFGRVKRKAAMPPSMKANAEAARRARIVFDEQNIHRLNQT